MAYSLTRKLSLCYNELTKLCAIAQFPNPGAIPGSYIRRMFRHPLFKYMSKEIKPETAERISSICRIKSLFIEIMITDLK